MRLRVAELFRAEPWDFLSERNPCGKLPTATTTSCGRVGVAHRSPSRASLRDGDLLDRHRGLRDVLIHPLRAGRDVLDLLHDVHPARHLAEDRVAEALVRSVFVIEERVV